MPIRPTEGFLAGLWRGGVIAMDPGKVTGVAWIRADMTGFDSLELPCWEAVDHVAFALALPTGGVSVVSEAFVINQRTLKKSRQYWSLESNGAVRWLCRFYGAAFETQLPGERDFATEAKLRALSWWRPTADGHQNSAAAHLLTYLWNKRMLTPDMTGKIAGVLR